mmetsp:Transcript_22203/g.36758  ORF Transcript_22203/g.36758 Transcript_22203/m.36758 type:complete len:212 (-) Transcript_22203:716-1351(-)
MLVPLASATDSFFKFNLRLVSQQTLRFFDVGAGVGNITGLVRHDADVGFLANMLLNKVDEFLQGCSRSLPKVEDLILVRTVDRADNSVDDIANVSVVTAGRTVSKLLNLHSTTDAIDELEGSHVWTSTRTIDGEEAKTCDIELVKMVVGVSQELTRLLRGSIRRHGAIDCFILREKGGLRTSIDGRGRSVHKILHAKFVAEIHQTGGCLNV